MKRSLLSSLVVAADEGDASRACDETLFSLPANPPRPPGFLFRYHHPQSIFHIPLNASDAISNLSSTIVVAIKFESPVRSVIFNINADGSISAGEAPSPQLTGAYSIYTITTLIFIILLVGLPSNPSSVLQSFERFLPERILTEEFSDGLEKIEALYLHGASRERLACEAAILVLWCSFNSLREVTASAFASHQPP